MPYKISKFRAFGELGSFIKHYRLNSTYHLSDIWLSWPYCTKKQLLRTIAQFPISDSTQKQTESKLGKQAVIFLSLFLFYALW